MTATEMLQRLHQHRAWVNGNLLAAASALSDEQLRAAFPIGQGSVWKSLLHLYGAEYVWLAALQGNEAAVAPGDVPGKLPGNQLGEGGIADLPDLRQKWEALERRYTDYLAGLPPEALGEAVTRYSLALQTRLSLRRSDVLLHVCTHAHYTVAQVVNMLRQCGVTNLPPTMIAAMASQEGNRA
ncbi:DinB family protein [Gemmata sp.]|uniref:DinB family protein n=1 Tax=Gemmata sp. TaxID=1914242 RepID=UPI003F712771